MALLWGDEHVCGSMPRDRIEWRPYLLFVPGGTTRVAPCVRAPCNRCTCPCAFNGSRRRFMVCNLTSRHLFSVAPMMDVTDKYFRSLARIISKRAFLYTEMIVDNVILYSDWKKLERILDNDVVQRPLCLQVGGSEPEKVSRAVHIAHQVFPYDEYNLNCGCPSDKVSSQGCFGAVLMKDPEKVARITSQVANKIGKPMSVKCRIGVDNHDSYEFLYNFVRTVSTLGYVTHFIIHARSAWLSGLSPKENRSKPPIRYDYVYRLVQDFPHLYFTLNGQVSTLKDVFMHLSKGVEGVMLGRAVMERPWDSLRLIDAVLYDDFCTKMNRLDVVEKYLRGIAPYEDHISRYVLVKPVLQLFAGEQNSRLFRSKCSDYLQKSYSASDAIKYALKTLPQTVLERENWNAEQLLCCRAEKKVAVPCN